MQLLHSKILGEGKPLLILHGFLGMSDNWKTLGNLYAKEGFRAHLIDQRNHGKSFHAKEFNYDLMAEDLERYMEHHHIPKAVILGHSMGGKTAMQLACTRPDRVENLLVADIAPKYYPPHHQDIINGLNAISLEDITSRGQAEEELSNHITDLGVRQFLLKNLYWIAAGKLGFRFNLSVLSHKLEEIGSTISSTASYTGPTLFLRGDRSNYISMDDVTVIKKHFPQARIETIEKAGHWLHAENPKQFFEKTSTFLNR
ncbi:MAG: alpha/beta fold hydrolase [Saonia sp.]